MGRLPGVSVSYGLLKPGRRNFIFSVPNRSKEVCHPFCLSGLLWSCAVIAKNRTTQFQRRILHCCRSRLAVGNEVRIA